MLGRAIGFGYCTGICCGSPKARQDRRRRRYAERRQWRREYGLS